MFFRLGQLALVCHSHQLRLQLLDGSCTQCLQQRCIGETTCFAAARALHLQIQVLADARQLMADELVQQRHSTVCIDYYRSCSTTSQFQRV